MQKQTGTHIEVNPGRALVQTNSDITRVTEDRGRGETAQTSRQAVTTTIARLDRDDLAGVAAGDDALVLPGLEGGDHRPHDQGGIGYHQMTTEGTAATMEAAILHTIRPQLAPTPGLVDADESDQETVW
jgi:hypothetical protein